ncbi:hypothetical protein [Melittangium boletus]|uniref:Uncharacterized protein n=1 Tax=Melittangium boletus DSM 14713 TaxID=1294270 RepID=A0A250IQN2_9BACT|nr:hypothetical protein [Melittangium boletus]ATB33563.1 hypothetical protein MEBOL_007061 [Melittangium boletus DSM 14713]
MRTPSRLTSGRRVPGPYRWVGLGWLLALVVPKCPVCLLALLGLAGGLEAGGLGAWLARWHIPHALVSMALAVIVLLTWRTYGWHRGVIAALIALGAWGTKFLMDSTLLPAVLGACIALLWLVPHRRKPSCCVPSVAERKGIPG